MRKALLIYLYDKMEVGLSLALGYLKATADADEEIRKVWDIEILHKSQYTEIQELVESIESSRADLVGFSCYSWNIKAVRRAVSSLSPGRKPVVVLGGVEVTHNPQDALSRSRNADFIVYGEGEETFRVLLRRLGEDVHAGKTNNLENIEGIAWRRGRSISLNPPRPPIADLSTIPSPYLSNSYGDYIKVLPRAPLESTRGCPFFCTYCFEPRGFKKVRSFPVERVKEEVKHLVKLGIPEIEFFDTNMNLQRQRALEIFRFLSTQGKRTRYWFELRGELLDEGQARAIAALEFFAEVGLQTTNPRSLEAVRRRLNKRKFEAGIKTLMDVSIYRPCAFSMRLGFMVDLIAGLPHDTVSDFFRTFDYTFGLVPSKIGISIMKILPGTELYDQANQFKYKFDPTDDHMIASSSTLTNPEVKDLITFSYAVFSAYNKLHTVRTLGWAAEEMQTSPSELFMEIGRDIVGEKDTWEDYTAMDLCNLLKELSRKRGHDKVARWVAYKLSGEMYLNWLQKFREDRRSLWSRLLFGLGYRFLRLLRCLAPLPKSASYDTVPARGALRPRRDTKTGPTPQSAPA